MKLAVTLGKAFDLPEIVRKTLNFFLRARIGRPGEAGSVAMGFHGCFFLAPQFTLLV
jgi:hypothetical protein